MDKHLIFELIVKACILVTFAFLLTRTRLFPTLTRPEPSLKEQAIATILLLLIGLAEVYISAYFQQKGSPESPMNLRIVAASVAGLLAGPWVGTLIGIAVTAISIKATGHQTLPIGTSMVLAGLLGGLLHRFRSDLASRPLTGLVVGASVSLLRDALVVVIEHKPQKMMLEAALFQGIAVALILWVIQLSREQEEQARAADAAEVRALQARMNPHFLLNSLNLCAALSAAEPAAVPRATAHLGRFLRSAIDLHDQTYISLAEEIGIVDAYLEIESLRFGDRLAVSKDVPERLLRAKVPPFLLQPLVENSVQHGIQPRPEGGTVRIWAREADGELLLGVTDDGVGIKPQPQDDGHIHALDLLRRRLKGLYGSQASIRLSSRPGGGAKVLLRIPYQAEEEEAKPEPIPVLGSDLLRGNPA